MKSVAKEHPTSNHNSDDSCENADACVRVPPIIPSQPINSVTARHLIAARNAVRAHAESWAIEALASALVKSVKKFHFIYWLNGQSSTWGGTAEVEGNGFTCKGTVPEYADFLRKYAPEVHDKGRGLCVSLSESRYCGSSDRECVGRYGLFGDVDDCGSLDNFQAVLDSLDVAYVIQRRPGTDRSHVELFFSKPIEPPQGDEDALHHWKRTVYEPLLGWLLGFFSEVAGLACRMPTDQNINVSKLGFDAATTRLIQLGNPFSRRKPSDPIPETVHRDGAFLDWEVLLAASGYREYRESANKVARERGEEATESPDHVDNPEPPRVSVENRASDAQTRAMFNAATEAKLAVRAKGEMLVITCPWQHGHSSSSGANDTSTVLLPGGLFKCLHGSCGNRTQTDFFEALPAAAQRVYLNALHIIARENLDALFAPYVVEAAARLSMTDIDAYAELFADIRTAAPASYQRWNLFVSRARCT